MSIPASQSNIIPLFHKESQNNTDSMGRPFPLRLLQDQDYTLILGRSCASALVPKLPETWQQARSTIQLLGQTCASLDCDGLKIYIASATQEEESEAHADYGPTTRSLAKI